MLVYVVPIASLATNTIVFWMSDIWQIYTYFTHALYNSAKHVSTINFIYIHSWTNSEKNSKLFLVKPLYSLWFIIF